MRIEGDAGGGDCDYGESDTSGPDGLDLDLSGKDNAGGGDASSGSGGDYSDSGAAGTIGAVVQGKRFDPFVSGASGAPRSAAQGGTVSSGATTKRRRNRYRGVGHRNRRTRGDFLILNFVSSRFTFHFRNLEQ